MAFLDKVKGVADTIVDSVEKGAKNVSDNSKKMADKMRVKKEITKEETDINAAYIEIGKKYFELNADKPAEEYASFVNTIINAKMKLTDLNAELQSLNNKTICPNCSESIDENTKFCPKCGAKIPVATPPVNKEPDAVEVAEVEVVEATVITEDNKTEE